MGGDCAGLNEMKRAVVAGEGDVGVLSTVSSLVCRGSDDLRRPAVDGDDDDVRRWCEVWRRCCCCWGVVSNTRSGTEQQR